MTARTLRAGRCVVLAAVTIGGLSTPAVAQQTVQMTVPIGVSFPVTNIAVVTPGTPAPTVVVFANGSWPPPGGRDFVISVRADAGVFTPPSGGAIPAAAVSWSASTAVGQAFSNSLSATAFRSVYQSPKNTPAGSVAVTWQLAALTAVAGLRPGTHTLTVRWRLELQ